VEIRISVAAGGLADLESLDEWLGGERGLAGRVKLARSAPRDGEMGAVSESLVVAVGSGGAITVAGAALAGALKAWLGQGRRSDVRVKVARPDGTSVEIDAKRVRAGEFDIQAAISQVLDPGSAGGSDSGTAGE
jgi:hypothetical protein